MPISGVAPLTIDFTDTSSAGGTSWLWQFGDGNTSASQNPSHTYVTNGTYVVTLTATGPLGSINFQDIVYVGSTVSEWTQPDPGFVQWPGSDGIAWEQPGAGCSRRASPILSPGRSRGPICGQAAAPPSLRPSTWPSR